MEISTAVQSHQLAPSADSDEAVRLLTVLMSGLITQQMANQPGVTFESGLFTRLTDRAFEMFIDYYRPVGMENVDANARLR